MAATKIGSVDDRHYIGQGKESIAIAADYVTCVCVYWILQKTADRWMKFPWK